QKRRIEKEGATIDEGVIGHLERLSRAAGGTHFRQNRLVHLQVRLEFQSVAGIPTLLACECGQVFLLEGGGEFASGAHGNLRAAVSSSRFGNFQSTRGHRQQSFALQKGEQVAVERR